MANKEEDDSCDIRIYEPKNAKRATAPQASGAKLRIKDLVDDEEDDHGREDGGGLHDDEDEIDHENEKYHEDRERDEIVGRRNARRNRLVHSSDQDEDSDR